MIIFELTLKRSGDVSNSINNSNIIMRCAWNIRWT